jgi:hypothetical protein
MLRIPVYMHNVGEEKVFRPGAWTTFGTAELEGADFRLLQLWPALRQKPPLIRHGKVHCFFDGPKIGDSLIYGNSPVGQLFKWTETLGRRDGAVGNVGASSRKV